MFASAPARRKSLKPSPLPSRARAMSTQVVDVSEFVPLRTLGQGSFGAVLLVRKRSAPNAGRAFAMKIMDKEKMIRRNITERASKEILRSRGIRASRGSATPRVIHRDLKPANVLLDLGGHCAIADYGLAVALDTQADGARASSARSVGTLSYMAPEFLRKDATTYDERVDWPPRDLFANIVRADAPAVEGDGVATAFVGALLRKQAADRPRWKKIRRHAFFADVDFGKLERRELASPLARGAHSVDDDGDHSDDDDDARRAPPRRRARGPSSRRAARRTPRGRRQIAERASQFTRTQRLMSFFVAGDDAPGASRADLFAGFGYRASETTSSRSPTTRRSSASARAEVRTAASLEALASCYLRQGAAKRAYAVLCGCASSASRRYLLAVACYKLDKLAEAEAALLPDRGAAGPKASRDLLLGPGSPVPHGAAGLHLLGVVCQHTHRRDHAVEYYRLALRLGAHEPSFDEENAMADAAAPPPPLTAATKPKALAFASRRPRSAYDDASSADKPRAKVARRSDAAPPPEAPRRRGARRAAGDEPGTRGRARLGAALLRAGWVQHHVGKVHFEAADYEAAVRSLRTMRRVEPHRMAGLELLSTALWHLKDDVELCYLARHCVDFDARSPGPEVPRLRHLRRAALMEPKNPQARFQCANVLISLDKYEDALAELRAVSDHAPREASVHFLMGKVCKKLGRLDDAMMHFTFALDLEPRTTTPSRIPVGDVADAEAGAAAAERRFSDTAVAGAATARADGGAAAVASPRPAAT
ncbi:hypothetical protein JL720_14443 [Aureococcus anophagefferens]|nr:hypothetical protein JL720_14443 [Aureococcus anophagefferens]